jgi:hypothetical protein
VEYAVTVTLELGAVGALVLIALTLCADLVYACAGVFAENTCFAYLDLFAYCHTCSPTLQKNLSGRSSAEKVPT